ncbi:hypothetical protein P8452_32598 [Trifolium repens]|nr:hypothetical protein P8452_32598 [Trifolium repens]
MSQSPITTSPTNSTEAPNSSPLNPTLITTIHPSFASVLNPKPKKTTAKRTSTAKTPKSKKKAKTSSSSVSKKSTKAKSSKSKSIHTMQELYVDDLIKGNAESNVEASNKDIYELNVEKGNSDFVAVTLETQKGVTGDDTGVAEVVGEEIV